MLFRSFSSPFLLGIKKKKKRDALVRGQQACLVCPEANEKECKNWKLIKKAETKNHHQIILGNHEFSGKRLEEKSEKGKRYHRKCETVLKVESNFNHKI